MQFDKLERKFIDLSLRRYDRWFYRWGHLLGWLALPVGALMLLPAFRPYAGWLCWLGIVLLFERHFVVTTRVIGKLARGLGLIGGLAMPRESPLSSVRCRTHWGVC